MFILLCLLELWTCKKSCFKGSLFWQQTKRLETEHEKYAVKSLSSLSVLNIICRKELFLYVRTVIVLTHLNDLQEGVVDIWKNSHGFWHICMICRKEFLTYVEVVMVSTHFCDLQERVLDICKNSRGVDLSIFQTPEKLHLTLGTLVIMDENERATAVKTLGECKANVIV